MFTAALEVLPPETIPAPAQLYVTLGVIELASTVAVPPLQLSDPVVTAFASGTIVFVVTVVVDVFTHPFTGSVTVTVKIPDAFTIAFAVFPAETIPEPVQLYVAPGVVELPFTVTVLFEQVNVPVVDEFASGNVVLVVTGVIEIFEQPLDGSVTVNV